MSWPVILSGAVPCVSMLALGFNFQLLRVGQIVLETVCIIIRRCASAYASFSALPDDAVAEPSKRRLKRKPRCR